MSRALSVDTFFGAAHTCVLLDQLLVAHVQNPLSVIVGAAHTCVVLDQVFEALGPSHPATAAGRRQLAKLLFM